MAISKENLNRAKTLITIAELSIARFESSQILSASEKQGFAAHALYCVSLLQIGIDKNKLSTTNIKIIQSGILEYWNSSTNSEIESFWRIIVENKYPIERSDTVQKIISKQRFKNVEQAIDIYNSIEKDKSNLENQNTDSLERRLLEVVEIDREKRIKQLKKCIRNNRVSDSSYLKFGENFAYIIRTKQLESVFDKNEQAILNSLRYPE